jgi:hypothetical protein
LRRGCGGVDVPILTDSHPQNPTDGPLGGLITNAADEPSLMTRGSGNVA